MPSRPKLRQFERHIENLGGDHVVFDQIAAGDTMEEVASSFRGFLKGAPEFPSRSWMYVWIHHGGEERERAWQRAKETASHALVERAGEILENEGPDGEPMPPATSAEASWLKQRAEHAKWLAGKFNEDDYGEKKDETNVNISVADLHLDALRSAGSMEGRETEAVEGRDYELLEGEE